MALHPEPLPTVAEVYDLPGPEQGNWTYKDYAKLPDDGKHYEIMNGFLLMSPSPNGFHQDIILEIASYLRVHINLTGLGLVRIAPFDVELAPDVVVQPDVLVVLKAHFPRIADNRLVGAPDLVVEVASPGTATYDRNHKYRAYARAGVQEYWIVDPEARTVEVLTLANQRYQSSGLYRGQAVLSSRLVPALRIPVEQFFKQVL